MSRTVAFIPARSGSSRIESKNLITGPEIDGETLLARACRTAVGGHLVVSTDDEPTGRWAESIGAEWHHRPESLAGPHAQIETAIAHWMHRCDPVLADDDVVCLLQLTSPLRRPETIRRCVELVQSGYDSAVTVTLDCRNTGRLRSHTDGVSMALWNRPVDSRPRSQEARRYATENGVCWAFSAGHFRRTKLRMGGLEAAVVTSWLEAFEVDTHEDLRIARALVGVADA